MIGMCCGPDDQSGAGLIPLLSINLVALHERYNVIHVIFNCPPYFEVRHALAPGALVSQGTQRNAGETCDLLLIKIFLFHGSLPAMLFAQ